MKDNIPAPTVADVHRVIGSVVAVQYGADTAKAIGMATGVEHRRGLEYGNAASHLGLLTRCNYSGTLNVYAPSEEGRTLLSLSEAAQIEYAHYVIEQDELTQTFVEGGLDSVKDVFSMDYGLNANEAHRRSKVIAAWDNQIKSGNFSSLIGNNFKAIRGNADMARLIAREDRLSLSRSMKEIPPCNLCGVVFSLAGTCWC